MASFFLDTSAIVKRYLVETGSAWIRAICHPSATNELYRARITLVEFVSAVIRRRRGGALSAANATAILARFRNDWATDFSIVEITPAVLSNAAGLAESQELRAYDAVQLAANSHVRSRRRAMRMSAVTLPSSDLDLNAAATAIGIPVDDPNTHP